MAEERVIKIVHEMAGGAPEPVAIEKPSGPKKPEQAQQAEAKKPEQAEAGEKGKKGRPRVVGLEAAAGMINRGGTLVGRLSAFLALPMKVVGVLGALALLDIGLRRVANAFKRMVTSVDQLTEKLFRFSPLVAAAGMQERTSQIARGLEMGSIAGGAAAGAQASLTRLRDEWNSVASLFEAGSSVLKTFFFDSLRLLLAGVKQVAVWFIKFQQIGERAIFAVIDTIFAALEFLAPVIPGIGVQEIREMRVAIAAVAVAVDAQFKRVTNALEGQRDDAKFKNLNDSLIRSIESISGVKLA